jgi:hypothetical protein
MSSMHLFGTLSVRVFGALVSTAVLGTQAIACAGDTSDGDAAWSSADLGAVPLSTADLVGLYDGSGPMANMQVRNWNGQPMLTADISYPSFTFRQTEFLLAPTDGDPTTLVGSSNVRVSYPQVQCSYPVTIVVVTTRNAEGDVALYVRDNRPVAIPGSIPSAATSCPPIAGAWRTDPDPYIKRSPVSQFGDMVDALCTSATARVSSVTAAKRLTTVATLPALPSNIFSASGDWESLSTPDRDTTLRGQIKAIYDFVAASTTGSDAHLVADRLKTALDEHSAACHLSYPSSTGAAVALPLENFVSRAYKLSFDPYHCPELRWGADPSTPEFATCNTQDAARMHRYTDEQTLRNYVVRPPNGPTPLGSGPQTGDEIDFGALIQRL